MWIAAFFAIAVYNVIETVALIFFTFKKRTGLYFWSLLVASGGIILHVLGFFLKFFQLCTNNYVDIVIITLGGVPMVIGQSVVLYSRLHLVVQDRRRIRWILVMIMMGFFLFTIPPTILNFLANSPNPTPFLQPFAIYEKIMLFGFATEECIISGLYIWETSKMLRLIKTTRGKDVRRVWRHLLYVNVLVIALDFTLIGIEFGGLYQIETTYKSALYSVKLKLEFAVLNQLRSLVQRDKLEASRSYGAPYPNSPRMLEQAIGSGNTSTTSSTTAPPSESQKESLFIAVTPMGPKA
ncbi:hypothetical protein BDZ45DRAFT_682247 [Acephala macrosclerotiorum]|nr:hypothetical protein BDZ45DRAFT_682247 [Acephala macrosclerotiorum]